MKKKKKFLLVIAIALFYVTGCCKVFNICQPLPPSLAEQQAYAQINYQKQAAEDAVAYAKMQFEIFDKDAKFTQRGDELYKLYKEAVRTANTYIDCIENQQTAVLKDCSERFDQAVKSLSEYVNKPKLGIAPALAADVIKGLVDGGIAIWKAANYLNEEQKKAKLQEQKDRLEKLRLADWKDISK